MGTQYILIEKAAEELGVQRSTMYYYLKQLKIDPKKFPLDRRTYITNANLDDIKAAKKAAFEKKH